MAISIFTSADTWHWTQTGHATATWGCCEAVALHVHTGGVRMLFTTTTVTAHSRTSPRARGSFSRTGKILLWEWQIMTTMAGPIYSLQMTGWRQISITTSTTEHSK